MSSRPIDYIWGSIKQSFNTKQAASLRLDIDRALWEKLNALADDKGQTIEEITMHLLDWAANQMLLPDVNHVFAFELTVREQEVAALACLGYTNKEIAAKLTLSPETVKSHLHKLVRKFGIRTKGQLRLILQDLDFSEFEAELDRIYGGSSSQPHT